MLDIIFDRSIYKSPEDCADTRPPRGPGLYARYLLPGVVFRVDQTTFAYIVPADPEDIAVVIYDRNNPNSFRGMTGLDAGVELPFKDYLADKQVYEICGRLVMRL